MIYTGYFAKAKMYEAEGLQPISIAGKADFFKGPKFPSFAPRYEVFRDWKKGIISDMEYTSKFRRHLDSLDKEAVKRFLTSFDKDIVLLCFEKPGDFCHRHIVADWIEENLGLCVEEYTIGSKDRENQLIDMLKSYLVTKEDLMEEYNMSEKEVDQFIQKLESNPPEGFFLLEQKGEYTLENKKEFLAEYGVYNE